MKRLVFILIIVLSSSVFAFAADNAVASAWLDFEAYKNHSLPDGAPSNWDYSIRVIDYIQSDAGRTVNNKGEEIVVDKKLLSSKYTHFFDVVYTSNSVFYPVKISVQVADFKNDETGSIIEVHTKYEPSWQWTNEYESAEISIESGWSFPGIDKIDLENNIKEYPSDGTPKEVEDNSAAVFNIGIPYNSSFRSVFHDRLFGRDWYELKEFVPIYWDNCFKTEGDTWKTYYYRKHYADIEYKIKTSISCPSLPENAPGKYSMPVTISVETNL